MLEIGRLTPLQIETRCRLLGNCHAKALCSHKLPDRRYCKQRVLQYPVLMANGKCTLVAIWGRVDVSQFFVFECR